jgi:hypothetical protein
MNRTVVVGIAAVAAIGGLWWMVRSNDPAEVEASDATEPTEARAGSRENSTRDGSRARTSSSEDQDLTQRVARLERQVAQLQRQAGMRTAARALGDDDTRADWDEDAAEPEFAEGVRAVLEEEKEKERERWIEARREGWEEMTNEILDDLVSEAGISSEHREALYQAWSAEAEQVLPLVMQARSGEISWRDIRGQIDEIRDETDTAAKEMLTAEQYAAYEESRPRGGPRGRGGRGGGERGGRGGGPPGPPPR